LDLFTLNLLDMTSRSRNDTLSVIDHWQPVFHTHMA